MSDDNGFVSGFVGGLLGPSEDDLDKLRKKYGIPAAETPPTMARIGRCMMDAWEPMKQMYLNHFHPDQAAAYRAQRQEGEQLYQRGLLSADPQPGVSAIPAEDDPWRSAGRAAVIAPAVIPGIMSLPMTGPEMLMSFGASSGAYSALDDLRRRLGILTD